MRMHFRRPCRILQIFMMVPLMFSVRNSTLIPLLFVRGSLKYSSVSSLALLN